MTNISRPKILTNSDRSIVLIGFMGSGKSSVALELARLLGYQAVEMDSLIAERAGAKNVAEIIDSKGEALFRDLESMMAQELGTQRRVVVSTGGGVVSRPSNREALSQSDALMVFLDAPFELLERRVNTDQGPGRDRPLFRDVAKARDLFSARHPLYREWATLTILIDNLTPQQIACLIVEKLDA